MYRLTFEQQCNLRDWIKALRSGKFEQTTGVLHRLAVHPTYPKHNVGFCCLGVGTYDQGVPTYSLGNAGTSEVFDFTLYGGRVMHNASNLPDVWLKEKYGLGPPVQSMLVRMNDKGNKTFAEIADYLESFLVGYEDGDDAFEVEGDPQDEQDDKASETYFD